MTTQDTQPPESGKQPAKPAWATRLKKLSPSLLLAVFFGALFSVQGAGFMVVYIIIPQAVLISVRLYTAIKAPVERQLNLGRVIIWLATIAAIYAVHNVRELTNRKEADEIVARIEAYAAASHGKCPTTIEDVGISRAELKDRLRFGGYLCKDGKRYLFYRGSFAPFSSWSYNFESREWHYRSD